ncbi:MAG: glycerol-3-phosphate acyltransferase [Acutalibacteraceae bacterium]
METDVIKYLLFALAGFVSGSIMYSYLIPKLFCGVDIVKEGEDHNPGMTNVMRCVSVKLGILCLVLDVAKGFVPVFLAKLYVPDYRNMLFALIIAAPVLGHAFTPILKFKGGKAIATSYGVLLALIPDSFMVLRMAIITAIFSLIIIVKPDSLRVIISMFIFAVCNFFFHDTLSFVIGSLLVSATVILKHFMNYGNEKVKISLPFHKKSD